MVAVAAALEAARSMAAAQVAELEQAPQAEEEVVAAAEGPAAA